MNPNSKLWLCKTNLENDYGNTLTFSSVSAQRNYFIGNPSDPTDFGVATKGYEEYTYLRLEQAIKVDDFIENIDTNNYLVLLNNNKYYYYFITSMSYIDDDTTKIHIELDVMQTYFFDIEYNQTFVEREHVTDDTPGKHTIPEGLETGDYIGSDPRELTSVNDKDYIIFQVVTEPTGDPTAGDYSGPDTQYGGIYSGCEYRIFDVTNAGRFIRYMDEIGKRDYIINIFMYHGVVEDDGLVYTITNHGVIVCEYTLVKTGTSALWEQDIIAFDHKPTTVGYYTPRNKKLLTYPYCYFLLNNNGGTSKVYKWEDFEIIDPEEPAIKFSRLSTPSVGGSNIYYPWNYKMGRNYSSALNENEGFVGAKFPTCSWVSDGYINWLTQTSVNREDTLKEDIGGSLLGLGITTLGGLSGSQSTFFFGGSMLINKVGDTIDHIHENVKAKEQHKLAPAEIRGNSSVGDAIYGFNRCVPFVTDMFIKEEYAKIIDKYFDMYGYQVNTLKTPSIHTRTNWNYIKTQNCNFAGNIPQEYMSKIKTIFNKGITFWHNPSNMFNYSLSNNVIS